MAADLWRGPPREEERVPIDSSMRRTTCDAQEATGEADAVGLAGIEDFKARLKLSLDCASPSADREWQSHSKSSTAAPPSERTPSGSTLPPDDSPLSALSSAPSLAQRRGLLAPLADRRGIGLTVDTAWTSFRPSTGSQTVRRDPQDLAHPFTVPKDLEASLTGVEGPGGLAAAPLLVSGARARSPMVGRRSAQDQRVESLTPVLGADTSCSCKRFSSRSSRSDSSVEHLDSGAPPRCSGGASRAPEPQRAGCRAVCGSRRSWLAMPRMSSLPSRGCWTTSTAKGSAEVLSARTARTSGSRWIFGALHRAKGGEGARSPRSQEMIGLAPFAHCEDET